jgi:Zn-dependent protease/CBS domain-containing protein
MTNGIPIGRFFGFPVRMHWSILVLIWLFAWSLASFTLPAAAPGHGAAVYWLAGVCGAVLLIASVLAHEIMHAVVARRHNLGVKDLTLWMFGGMATFTDEPKTPGADFRIAAAGPATSLALAGVFAAATAAGSAVGLDPRVVRVGWWLAGVNLLLGLFNLLPGAPLDGGRIVRAILWFRSKDRQRAAVGAARAGLVLGGVLIGLGLLEFLSGRIMGGIWTVFIGWFLLSAARSEQQQATVIRLLDGVRVQDVMTAAPDTAPGWFTVEAFVSRYVMARPHSAFPVTDFDGQVRGLITLNQLRSVPPADRGTTRVSDVAIPLERVPKATPGELLVEVFGRLTKDTGGRVLVFDGDHLVGIVTRADLSRILELRSVATPPGDTQS